MSYTPPSGDAASFSWVGVAAYTPPSGDAANFGWAMGNVATGFSSTALGVPSTPMPATGFSSTQFGTPALAFRASGFSATEFGHAETLGYHLAISLGQVTAFGLPQRAMYAAGFCPTAFGGPNTPTPAQGWQVTTFGAPRGFEFWQQRSLPPATRFGQAYFAFDQTGTATGRAHARLGWPTSYVDVPLPVSWITRAAGFLATRFGTPSTAVDTTSAAVGTRVTRFGSPFGLGAAQNILGPVTRFGQPTARTSHAADSVGAVTAFGTARSAFRGQALGWRAMSMGTPRAGVAYAAAGFTHTRFGVARTSRPNVYRAWPCDARARFGCPHASLRFNYAAAALGPLASFGTPAATFTTRARALAPVVRFGTPTRGGIRC